MRHGNATNATPPEKLMHYNSISEAVKAKYERKFVTPAEAVSVIHSGDRVYIHPGCAVPQVLVEAMVERYEELHDVEVCHLLGVGEAAYVRPEMKGHFRHNAFFIGKNVRKAVCDGRADFTPIFLSEIPALLYDRHYPVDVALIQVSPPDEHGYCSFGVGVECTKAATEVAKIVVAQINTEDAENARRLLHPYEQDRLLRRGRTSRCRRSPRWRGMNRPEEIEVYQKIGAHVAGLVEDGSTLQLGHRPHPRRRRAIPGGPEASGHPLRNGLGRDHPAGRVRRHHEHAQDAPSREDRHLVCPRLAAALRVHRQQPCDGVPPDPVYQRPVHDRPEQDDGRHQFRDRDRPHRPGVRRHDRVPLLQRVRGPGGFHPRGGQVRGGKADHRPPVNGEGRNDFAHHPARSWKGRVSRRRGATSITW